MNLYFGKVSQKFDLKQIEDGYYEAPMNSTWFGDLKIGDFVYLIGGGKIQFWKAKEWKKVNGSDRLYFDILNDDLGINVNDLIAIKYFKLTKAFIVLTSRSARNRAFFHIEQLENIPVDQLADSDFYKNENIYRQIRITNESDIDTQAKDIQIYLKDEQLKIFNATFISSDVINSFRDNLKYQGQGSKLKDNTLAKIKDNILQNTVFSNKQLGLRTFYDAFFCEYVEKKKYFVVGAFWKDHEPEDMTDSFVSEARWENGYDDKFNEKVKQIPDGSSIAIKAAYVKEKTYSVINIKARGVVSKNHGDGKHLDVIWEQDFIPFEIPVGSYRQTIHEVTNKEHIESIWDNETLNEVEDEMDTNDLLALLTYKKQIILQGPPGTGKTRLAKKLASLLTNENSTPPPSELDNSHHQKAARQKLIQFHPSYTYEDFVRGITSKPNKDGKGISYDVENKTLALIARQAIEDPANQYVLIIDEINRANLSSVLGELIYALEYRNEPVEGMYELENSGKQLTLPSNLYIIGTMNTADRSVGHIDYAIRRRFAFVDVLPKVLENAQLEGGQQFAKNLFIKVGKLFINDYQGQEIKADQNLKKSEYLSGEFDPKEVMLGHSYFIEKENCPISIRLAYEIKPILTEYVKDGILQESALAHINNLTV